MTINDVRTLQKELLSTCHGDGAICTTFHVTRQKRDTFEQAAIGHTMANRKYITTLLW